MPQGENAALAEGFDAIAHLLREQHANPFRVNAYLHAAHRMRALDRPVGEVLRREGLEGLEALPDIGPSLAAAIRDYLRTGRLALLDRLRGESDPEALLETVPGIGPTLAHRLHDELGIATLEGLEAAAHGGQLDRIPGLGSKRIAGIKDALAGRLGRRRRATATGPLPSVAELLDVDRAYREQAAQGTLKTIAPRRFNPTGESWLPVLHTTRGERQYTALFSNTARAHELGKTDDWVVLYFDGGEGEHQATVVTGAFGRLAGRRIVRGREVECERYYAKGA